MSGRPSVAYCVQAAPPTWPAPTVSGPRPCDQPLPAHPREPQRIAHVVVERVARLQPNDGARLVVVLQVLADARAIGDDRDAVLPQQVGRTDAGELQELRRLQRAGREDDLALRARGLRRCPARPIRRRRRACLRAATRVACAPVTTVRLGARHRRTQERDGRALAPALADAQLIGADAVGRRAVEVAVGGQAELLRRLDPRAAGRMIVAQGRDVQAARARRDTGWARRRSSRACGSRAARRDSPSPRRRLAPSRRNPRAGRG